MIWLAEGNAGITRECTLRQSLQIGVNFLQVMVPLATDVASLSGEVL